MGLNLSRTLEYTGKNYIGNTSDPVNNVEKIDSNAPYVLSTGIHIGTIDFSRWETTLDAYRGIGINRYGLYGVAEEHNTATPKFLLTADYIQDFGWGSAVPGEFRVGDNVREEAGFLVGKNWLWYTPIKGLNISGPLLRTISSDTNIIQSPGFDNITEFVLENGVHDSVHGYPELDELGYCIVFAETGRITVKGRKTIDGAAILRGSVMFANSDNFPIGSSILVEVDIFDINGNLITTSSSAIQPAPYGEWKRHNYALRLGPHDNEDSFEIRLIVRNLVPGYGHYVVFDNWNAYRVFQASIDAFDLPDILPESSKSVIYDAKGIRAYWPDARGEPKLTFELSAADGNAFFAGNMEVRGYVHSGPVYLECNPDDPYNPTDKHEIIGCGLNKYLMYGVSPNFENVGYYNIGRTKFLLASRSLNFTRSCDQWYWGQRVLSGEFRCGDGVFYDEAKHDLFTVISPDDIEYRKASQYYLWFFPGDKTLDPSDKRYYPFLTMKGSMLVNGFVHSGPVYDLDFKQHDIPIIGGCGINQYAIYGIKTVGDGTDTNPFQIGESRFTLANTSVQFGYFDPYWGDELFEGELRVGLNILYDSDLDELVDINHNPSESYMWFRPLPPGSTKKTKFIVKADIIAGEDSEIPPEAIDGVSDGDEIVNSKQRWEDVNLSDTAKFLEPSKYGTYPTHSGLAAHNDYIGYFYEPGGGGLYSWRFKVDSSGKTFFGKYGTSSDPNNPEDRNFVYWDGSKLRIEGAVYAYKGFFKDLVYIGDENEGIEIYGGDHSNVKQSSVFVDDPSTNEKITFPYIRSSLMKPDFSQGGWVILQDGYASFSRITGIGRNLHLTTSHYWIQDNDGNWERKENFSFSGFHSTYTQENGGLDVPACAMYLHDASYDTNIANYTIGMGCFKSGSSYSLLLYNSNSEYNYLNDVRIDTKQITSIHLHTDRKTHNTGSHGLYLQKSTTEPIGFFGTPPKVRKHITLPGALWESGDINKKLDYIAREIGYLYHVLGIQSNGTSEGMGIFSWLYDSDESEGGIGSS